MQSANPRRPGWCAQVWGSGLSTRRGRLAPARLTPGSAVESSDWYYVVGLVLLVLVFLGPGMWSENWGWDTLDRVAAWFQKRKRKP